MSYEARDPNVMTVDEMRAWQNMAAFDKDDYERKYAIYKNGDSGDNTITPFMPDLDGSAKTCKCAKEYVPSKSQIVTHYACHECRQGECKYGAYQVGGECCFLAKMSLPGMMGHVIKSCANIDAHEEADVISPMK